MSHDILSKCIEQREALARRLDQVKAEADAAKALLARYIRHVEECEGVNFITTGTHHSDDNFTPDEWAALRKAAGVGVEQP